MPYLKWTPASKNFIQLLEILCNKIVSWSSFLSETKQFIINTIPTKCEIILEDIVTYCVRRVILILVINQILDKFFRKTQFSIQIKDNEILYFLF